MWNIKHHDKLGGGNSNIFGIFTPKIGEDEPILTNIFQRGWNHHLVNHISCMQIVLGTPRKFRINLNIAIFAVEKHLPNLHDFGYSAQVN